MTKQQIDYLIDDAIQVSSSLCDFFNTVGLMAFMIIKIIIIQYNAI